jgi:hypothetical protein
MAKATARHILVSSEDKCNELKAQIEGGADFAEVAKANSTARPAARAVIWVRSVLARWSRNSTPWSSARQSTSCKVQ